jgi:DNA polymerase III delta prime subunit
MAAALIKNIGKTVVGKPDAVELVLVALLCQGHMLLEDVPGVGKTLLAKALARSLGCTFRRIQFTPDLLRSDVTEHHRLLLPRRGGCRNWIRTRSCARSSSKVAKGQYHSADDKNRLEPAAVGPHTRQGPADKSRGTRFRTVVKYK